MESNEELNLQDDQNEQLGPVEQIQLLQANTFENILSKIVMFSLHSGAKKDNFQEINFMSSLINKKKQ